MAKGILSDLCLEEKDTGGKDTGGVTTLTDADHTCGRRPHTWPNVATIIAGLVNTTPMASEHTSMTNELSVDD